MKKKKTRRTPAQRAATKKMQAANKMQHTFKSAAKSVRALGRNRYGKVPTAAACKKLELALKNYIKAQNAERKYVDNHPSYGMETSGPRRGLMNATRQKLSNALTRARHAKEKAELLCLTNAEWKQRENANRRAFDRNFGGMVD